MSEDITYEQFHDKIESLIDTIDSTIRHGGISNDTRVIAQCLLLNALIIMPLAKKAMYPPLKL